MTWDNWGVSHPSEIAPNSQALVTISVEETNRQSGHLGLSCRRRGNHPTLLCSFHGGRRVKIAVLGVGSIGGVLLGALSDTDCDLVAISRGNSADQSLFDGLGTLHSPEGPIEAIPPERFETIDSESGPVPEGITNSCDAAFICGKSDSTPVLAQIADEILDTRWSSD